MAKSLNSSTVIPFLTLVPAGPQYKGPGQATLLKKAKNAFHAAKQRCRNPKHPSYPGYGAKGIKFLFTSVGEFLEDIGIPKSIDLSLDRIDPHGHYQPGNVRWVNPTVQGLNKKEGKYATLPSLQALISASEAQAAGPQQRRLLRDAWERAIQVMNCGQLHPASRDWFNANVPKFDFSANGWQFGQLRSADEPDSYFYLPSLTLSGESALVIGGPFGAQEAQFGSGTIRALGYVPINAYVPNCVMDWMRRDENKSSKAGGIWIGQPSLELVRRGGFEGWMLAIASKLARSWSTMLCPALSLIDRLDELGHPGSWDEQKSLVLDCRYLFVPDLDIDAGPGLELSPLAQSQVAQLLTYRAERGGRTYLGVANIHRLGKRLQQATLSKLETHQIPAHNFSSLPKKYEATGPTMKEFKESYCNSDH